VTRLKGGVVEGRSEGPVRATCEVLARRREGAYWLLSLAARQIAERAQPGQFVEIAVGAPATLLRRPFSIARVSRQGASAGTFDIVFDAHGPGTEWLTTVDTHDVLDVVGPLGTPFPLPQRKVNCLLVGGGYGIAPLFFLAEALLRKGLRVDMINGAASAERLLGAIEAKRLSASVVFTTDDGTFGVQGRVTDVLDRVLDTSGAGLVYACGPNPMLRAVSEHCRDRGVPIQVAVEERMACGMGVCFTCVVPVRGRDGHIRNRRACLDGPVFNGARIDWDTWGVPGGASTVDVDGPAGARPVDADAPGGAPPAGTPDAADGSDASDGATAEAPPVLGSDDGDDASATGPDESASNAEPGTPSRAEREDDLWGRS
jgi:dihydroorotate dehydrogenase electron transfer subunit